MHVVSGLGGPGWWQTVRLHADPVGVLVHARRRFGDVFAITLLPAGELVVIADPEAATRVLVEQDDAGEANAATLPLTLAPRSVFVTGGTTNQHRRQIVQPPLSASVAERWQQALTTAVDQAVPHWPRSRPFTVAPRLRHLIAEAFVPYVVHSPHPRRQAAFLAAALARMSPTAALTLATLVPYPTTRPAATRMLTRRHAHFNGLLDEEIRRRRDRADDDDPPRDVLAHLLASRDEHGRPLDTATIIDEITSLLLAVLEVQTVALAWGVERLAHHPDIADELTAADARTGDYADAVACEVLRTRPPVIGAFRQLQAPTVLCGTKVPANTRVMAALPLLHHHADYYDNPSAFRPARFAHQPPATWETAWLPFGAGARHCLGADLARNTLRAALPAIATRTRLRPVVSTPETARLAGTLLAPGRLVTLIRSR